jgi:hypothetical protein
MIQVDNGTTHLYVVQTLKTGAEQFLGTKIMSFYRSFSSVNLLAVFKKTFLFNETKFSFLNCYQ